MVSRVFGPTYRTDQISIQQSPSLPAVHTISIPHPSCTHHASKLNKLTTIHPPRTLPHPIPSHYRSNPFPYPESCFSLPFPRLPEHAPPLPLPPRLIPRAQPNRPTTPPAAMRDAQIFSTSTIAVVRGPLDRYTHNIMRDSAVHNRGSRVGSLAAPARSRRAG